MYNSPKYPIIEEDWIPQHENEIEVPEWFEETSTDPEWIDNFSTTPMSESFSINSASFVDEFTGKNKLLEKQWKESDEKYKNLLVQHQQLIVQLSTEKQKSYKLQKNLEHVRDNQEMFSRLKQTYMNIKGNDDGKMLEVKEKACQTWAGIICQYCIETNEMARQLRLNDYIDGTLITVDKYDLARLQDTIQKLKMMIDDREKTWSYNADRETVYQHTIAELQAKVHYLKHSVSEKQLKAVASAQSANEMVQKENAFLRKIVIKLEKRYREMEKACKFAKRPPITLNEVEKEMVNQLIQKYSNKLKQKILAANVNNSSMSKFKICGTIDEEDQGDFMS